MSEYQAATVSGFGQNVTVSNSGFVFLGIGVRFTLWPFLISGWVSTYSKQVNDSSCKQAYLSIGI